MIKINAVGKKKKRKERGNVEFSLHLKNKQTNKKPDQVYPQKVS